MGLLRDAWTQAQVWNAYLRLNAPDEEERAHAMETLRLAGDASLFCLRYAVRQADQPRVQYAAAVALHWLGDPRGMETLIEGMEWKLPVSHEPIPELEAAFLTIGAPDAIDALLALWERLPAQDTGRASMEAVCRVFAQLRDPRALSALITRATAIPNLFLQTVRAFGETAVPYLSGMLQSPEPARRVLAVRALQRVAGGRAYTLLAPMLRDPDLAVRSEAPAALEMNGGLISASSAVAEAIRAGYGTYAAVVLLKRARPLDMEETLLRLIEQWNPQTMAQSEDMTKALLAALPALAVSQSLPNAGQALCALLAKQPPPAIAAEAARALSHSHALSRAPLALDAQIRAALWSLLAAPNSDVRSAAAEGLARLGEPLGRQLNQLLDACWPQVSLIGKLQAMLRGEQDAGQVATQAALRVSLWMTRVSQVAADRLNLAGPLATEAPKDPRLPGLLRRLLGAVLDGIEQTASPAPEENINSLSLCVACTRVIAQLGNLSEAETPTQPLSTPNTQNPKPNTQYPIPNTQHPIPKTSAPIDAETHSQLLRCLHLVKHIAAWPPGSPPGAPRTPMGRAWSDGRPYGRTREVGEVARGAAAEALERLYGADAFPLFLELLYSPQPEPRHAAVLALARLGDARALPHLQPLASHAAHPLCLAATEAIATIRRTNPEIMTLLRASSAGESQPETLLRPAGNSAEVPADQLLRPAP